MHVAIHRRGGVASRLPRMADNQVPCDSASGSEEKKHGSHIRPQR
jgi:hypothetical protein